MSEEKTPAQEFIDEVKRAQDDGNALFVELQAMMIRYMHENQPSTTGVALALIDLLSVWCQAMRAPKHDILSALSMNWDKIADRPQAHVESIREMDKHVN